MKVLRNRFLNLNRCGGLIFFIFCLFGCAENRNGKNLVFTQAKVLDSIPSASGIVSMNNDSVYIVGDDATAVYLLNLKDFQYQKVPLTGLERNLYRESKTNKHDFESTTLIDWKGNKYLLAFGSGSNLNTRDSLLLLNVSNKDDQQIVSLKDFYTRLRFVTHTDSTQWNIEGSATINDNLFLLNRGNNLIIVTSLSRFLEYVFQPGFPFPPVNYTRVKLPTIQGKEARLSGASAFNDTSLLFSASVEDTPDWQQDGPVLGSFVGYYSIKTNAIDTCYLLADKDGKPLIEKIESLDVLKMEVTGRYTIVAVSDNDDGSSKLFQLSLLMK